MILSPVVDSPQSREALHLACRLAAERRSAIVAMRVIVVPMDLPLDADLPEQEALADRLLDEAHDIGELYGVRVIERVARARHRGARDRRGGGAPERGDHRHGRAAAAAPDAPERDLRKDVDYVLKNADLPRDGRRRPPGRGVKATVRLRRPRLQLPLRRVGIGADRPDGAARRRSRLPDRRAVRRARHRAPLPPARGRLGSSRGPEAARPRARPRRARALLGRVRRDRLLDLLRARDRRGQGLGLTPDVLARSSGSSSSSSRSRMRRARRRSRRRAARPRSCARRSTTSPAS